MNLRRVIAWWAGLLAILGGCGAFIGGMSCAGSGPGSLNLQPTVNLKDAKYTSPIELPDGGKLSVVAHTNLPSRSAQLSLHLGQSTLRGTYGDGYQSEFHTVDLHDDGINGDIWAGDGEWYGEHICRSAVDAELRGTVWMHYPGQIPQQYALPERVLLYAPDGVTLADSLAEAQALEAAYAAARSVAKAATRETGASAAPKAESAAAAPEAEGPAAEAAR